MNTIHSMLLRLRRCRALCLLALATLIAPAAEAARLTLSLVRTTMDPTTWSAVQSSYVDALDAYAHIWEAYDLWGFTITTTADSIDFNYDLWYGDYDIFYATWDQYIDQINAAMAPVGLEYRIDYDANYTATMQSLSERYAAFWEIWHNIAWTPELGYIYSGYYPALYLYEGDETQWVYAFYFNGHHYYFIWGRGWVWSPDGSLDGLIDLGD